MQYVCVCVFVLLQSDRTFSFTFTTPPTSYFLKAASGIEKGSSKPGIYILHWITE